MSTADLTTSLLARRARLPGTNVSTFDEEPGHLVKGEGVWVRDADGNRYLDCCNNVPHVGHCHVPTPDSHLAGSGPEVDRQFRPVGPAPA